MKGDREKMRVEELVIKHQQGEEVFDQIVHEMDKFVWTIAHRLNIPGLDIEDNHSICLHGLLIASNKFDYSKGFKFSTYAGNVMFNHLSRELQNRKTKRRDGGIVESLDKPLVWSSGQELYYADAIPDPTIEKPFQRELIIAIDQELETYSEMEADVMENYLFDKGCSQSEMARKYGRNQVYISRLILKKTIDLQKSLREKGVA